VIVRPIAPEVPCTLGLIQHRNKPDSTALSIVRQALLSLQTPAARRMAARRRSAPPPGALIEVPQASELGVSAAPRQGPETGGTLSS